MGQGESKIDGSFAFAYLINPRKQFYITPPAKDSDPVLTRPGIYGLNSTYSAESSSLSSLDSAMSLGTDSSYDELAKDLAYVDHTYYPARKRSSTTDINITTNNKSHFELSMTDVVLASPDRTLTEVYLSSRSIHSLSLNMGMLTMIRKLDLSNNHLTELPESVGYMQNLESLSLSKNRLKSLPDTICYLSNLLELDVSFNEITDLTPYVGYLDKLKTLTLASNQLVRLPTEIRGLVSLISFELGRNPIRILPAEITKLPQLRRIRLDECPLDVHLEYPLKNDPPSLVELCARTVVRTRVNHESLPTHLSSYIKSAKSCTFCLGPYFHSHVLRGRLLEKADTYVPLEYTLCSSHWIDADDCVRSMFSERPYNAHDTVILPERPSLPEQPIHTCLPALSRRSYNPLPNVDTTNVVQLAKLPMDSRTSLSKLASKLKRPSIPW